MSSAGPNYCGTAANVAGPDADWANPTNCQGSSLSAYASASMDYEISDYLNCTNFGFSIPAGATIDGILVEVYRQSDHRAATTYQARLLKAGTPVGTSKGTLTWPSPAAWASLGGSTDLWGTTWTAAEVNATGFGFGVQASATDISGVAEVYGVRITVSYTASSSAKPMYAYAQQ